LRPEYYNIAENLELGTYSKPQKVAQGWVILMLKMKIPPTEYPLEQVKTHLKNQLINKRVDAKIDSILKELKAQHTLKSYPEKLSLMK
jgi:parvulin-like peptidyl-prolyl isomerase